MLKHFFLSVTLILAAANITVAQLTLENTFSYSVSTAYIDGDGYKFYEMDTDNNRCMVYNLDHSLYQTIDLEVPENHYLYDLKYVTNHLFDQDDGLEVCYTYYEYDDAEQSSTYTTRVINHDGSELLEVPGAAYATLMTTSEEGDYRFVVYIYDYSVVPSTVETNVYSLSGQTTSFSDLPGLNTSKAFPNPAKEQLTIEYDIPGNIRQAQLIVYNARGQVMMKHPLDSESHHTIVNTSMLPAGTYLYRIAQGHRTYVKDKFIIKH
jgi:hypothetical protein